MADTEGRLAGRVIVITGATRGLGKAVAESLAAAGASLGLLATERMAVNDLATSLSTNCVAVACDVAEPDEVVDAFTHVADALGGVDSVIATAEIVPTYHWPQRLPVQTWRQIIDVNLTGTFNTAQAAYPHLIKSGDGRLVLTSSLLVRAARPGYSAYVASKAGIEGLVKALSYDWVTDGICVNGIATELFDAECRAAFTDTEPSNEHISKVLDAVKVLASAAADRVTGHTFPIGA